MGSLSKNIQLTLVFLKAPFMLLNFSYYTSMTFLMMLSVILVSMLILSTVSVNWPLNLENLVDWDREWVVDLTAEKSPVFSFDQSNNSDAIYVKVNVFVLGKRASFKMLGLSLYSKFIGAFALALLLELYVKSQYIIKKDLLLHVIIPLKLFQNLIILLQVLITFSIILNSKFKIYNYPWWL